MTTKKLAIEHNETAMNSMKRRTTTLGLALLVAGTVSIYAADVKENWEKNCAKCHGADGAGKTKMGGKLGVKDYTDAKVQAEMKDEEMAKTIKEGKKDGDTVKMKAFGDVLNDDEIKALVAHVRSMKK